MFKWLFGGRRRNKPAASSRRDDTAPDSPTAIKRALTRPGTINGYEDNPQNKRIKRLLSKEKFDVIKRADARSKAAYDQIDQHITSLKDVKVKIKRCREERRALAQTANAG